MNRKQKPGSEIAHYRLILVVILLLLVPVGLSSKMYHGMFKEWVNDFSGDILYEAFWIILFDYLRVSIRQPSSTTRIAITVFLVTCGLEFLQLWHPPFLQAIRATFIGRTLIGTTFSLWDFPHYAIGCLLTWIGLRILQIRLMVPTQT